MKKRFGLGERIRRLFGGDAAGSDFYDHLEDLLVEADVGAALAARFVAELKQGAKDISIKSETDITGFLKKQMAQYLLPFDLCLKKDVLNVILVCGVNGVGKTTTIGKLVRFFQSRFGMKNIILCAADTFRAAATEQLVLWGERLGAKVIRQGQHADPGAVVFDALESARAKNAEVVIIDTSGRMHTKDHLVKELAKINKIVNGKIPPGCVYRKLLVIDTTTGQNALRQAEVFHEVLGLDAIILAKYDSSAKGGIAVAIGRELKLPFSFVGTGEKPDDLEFFRTEEFISSLFDAS